MELDGLQILLLILVGAGASFVQRVSGFGAGIFAMLFLPYLCGDTVTGAAISCLWSCVTSTYNAIKHRRDVQVRLVLPLVIASLAAIPLALRFSTSVPKETMTVLLGIVLIGLSLYFLLFSKRIHMKANVPNGIFAGALSGLLNGLFGTGGPPIVLYLANATADKTVYFACIQLHFAITGIYTTVMRAVNGILTVNIFLSAAVGLAGCLLGNWVGSLVFSRLNADRVKQVIYVGMILSGILMIL